VHDDGVAAASATELRTRGEALLASTDWEGARDALSQALSQGELPETLDSLARAEWWLGEIDAAIEHRERAYVAFRRSGDTSRAATTALWLAREYAEAVGNEPASNGWLARAEGLLRDAPPGAEHGWLAFTKGDRAFDPEAMRREADRAVASGRAFEDSDLEASALALLGRAMILQGDVEDGMTRLDEAMVAATSGEVDDPIAFGNICCLVTMACEEFGDMARLDRWNQVVEQFLSRYQHRPLLSFCGTCMADMALAGGDLKGAEAALVSALQALEGTGHRGRCVHPAARLAEILVLQGRVEEAERVIEGYEGLPDAARASVALHAAKGEFSIAAALLLRRLNQLESGGLLVAPLLEMLVEIQIAQGDLEVAASTAERLTAVATGSGQPRWIAAAELATGRVELAAHRPSARDRLESAVEGFRRLEMPLESARARLALARALQEAGEDQLAIREARVAAGSLERLGANREADDASALVRELGGPARTGAKGIGTLSKREIEVLRLLGEGLSNAEIAARLYISTKTAGNHVSNVLSKLGLRNRSEAAALAVRSGETTTV
jgi:DNA-binding CsgD family transcriptional regulator